MNSWKHESCRYKCLVVKLISLSRFLKVWRHTWFPNLQCNLLMLQNGVIYHHYLNFASPETYLICTCIFKVSWLFWEFLRNSLGSLWGIVTDCSHIYLRILIKFSMDFDQKIWKMSKLLIRKLDDHRFWSDLSSRISWPQNSCEILPGY